MSYPLRPKTRRPWFAAAILLLVVGGCGEPEVEQPTTVEIPEAPPQVEEAPRPPAPRAKGQRAGVRSLEVELVSARLFGDRLELELAFENVSDSSVGLLGELAAGDFALLEDAGGGETLTPTVLTEAMRTLDAAGGVQPGQRVVGGVAFPRPLGSTFELRVGGFEPLLFDWQHIIEARGGSPQIEPGLEPGIEPGLEPGIEPEAEDEYEEGSAPAEELPLVRHRGPPVDELDRLLEEQALAIASYDVDRYLGTFAADRRNAEREIFRRLRSLPVTGVRMKVGQLFERGPRGGNGHRARVELVFRLDGLPDDNPFVLEPTYSFTPAEGGWRVASIEDEENRPTPWRQGELEVHRSHHFLILSEPRMRSELAAVAADAEAAYAALQRSGLPLAPGYAVFFVADEADSLAATGQANALGAALGRYLFDGERVTVDSRAFYVNGPLFSRGRGPSLSAAARRTTVTHELVHLALAADTRPHTPPWLKEGVAVYFAGDLSFDANRSLVRRGLGHLDLGRMTRSTLGGHQAAQRQVADEYLFAGNTVAWLVERHGRDELLELYRSYAREAPPAVASLARPAALAGRIEDVRGAAAAAATEAVLQRHYGLGVAELDTAVKDWLRVPHL